jgi:hypothetical protein
MPKLSRSAGTDIHHVTTKLHLSKLDTALRQLETAVTPYFHHSDPVSIHTLTAAAYNVLRDIKKHRAANFGMFKDADMIYPERRREFLKMLNESENFFKHADKDPTADHEFCPEWTDFLLIDACEAYTRLTGERRPVLWAYVSWFCIRHPQYYETQPKVFQRASMLNREYKENERSTFFAEALTAGYNPLSVLAKALTKSRYS